MTGAFDRSAHVTTRWTAATAAAVIVSAGAVTACASDITRGPVSLAGQTMGAPEPSLLVFTVPSCNGDPELTDLDESTDEVRVEITTTQVVRGAAAMCLDSLDIELTEPLGDRTVVDVTSGNTFGPDTDHRVP